MPTLDQIIAALALPGMPQWTGLVPVVVLALALTAFLAMPFSVFGLKGRLEMLEAQLDEIQAELRALAMRLPEPAAPLDPDPPLRRRAEPAPPAPAVPPRVAKPEPRLDWPGSPRA